MGIMAYVPNIAFIIPLLPLCEGQRGFVPAFYVSSHSHKMLTGN